MRVCDPDTADKIALLDEFITIDKNGAAGDRFDRSAR